MAKSSRKPVVKASEKNISSNSMMIKKNKDADVHTMMLTLKSILPASDMSSSFDVMQQTIAYINDLNAVLRNCDLDEEVCQLQSLFGNQLNFNQQTTVFCAAQVQ